MTVDLAGTLWRLDLAREKSWGAAVGLDLAHFLAVGRVAYLARDYEDVSLSRLVELPETPQVRAAAAVRVVGRLDSDGWL